MQSINVVKGYRESEKLVMLKVSDDTSSAAAIAQLHQQSRIVMLSVSGLAQKFPELKASEQYQRLITSIQECESALEGSRQHYSGSVKAYNTLRSSVPQMFSTLPPSASSRGHTLSLTATTCRPRSAAWPPLRPTPTANA